MADRGHAYITPCCEVLYFHPADSVLVFTSGVKEENEIDWEEGE